MTAEKGVLIVDDLELNRILLAEIFKGSYRVFEASNGIEALELLRQETPRIDMVLLDIVMPVMDGFETLAVMREDAGLSGIPVVVITAGDDPDDEIKALNLGATDFITKPFDPRVVISRVRNIIERREIDEIKLENKMLRRQTLAQVQLQAILDNMIGGVALIEFSEQPHAIYMSPGFYSLTGCSKEVFEAHKDDFFFRVHPDDRPKLEAEIKAGMDRKAPISCEFRVIRVDDRPCWAHVQGIKISYPDSPHPVMIMIFTDITNEKENERQLMEANAELRYMAYHDSLTTIFNREAFSEMTSAMLRNNPDKEFVLICWNVERFKFINELFGKNTGDLILKDVAALLKREISHIGTYGRLEADHFAVCFPKDEIDIDALIGRIKPCEDFQRNHYELVIHVGVYEIEDPTVPVDQMCDRANLALQSVKGNYLRRCAYYTDDLRSSLLREQEVVREMSQSLEEGQFVPWLQPQYNHATGRIAGAEALARWEHPVRGLIPTGGFIPIFEKNGFISKLDESIWEQVCRLLRRWLDEGRPVVPVSVNISRVDIYNPKLESILTGLVKKYDIPISLFRLEITESACVENPAQLIKVISSLRERGFFIEMDDFGSGYSSLNSLKDMPIDLVKLDLKFLLGDDEYQRGGNILASVVRMTKWLSLPAIAEGVETAAQADFLKSIGCNLVQGYLYARPMPVGDFEALLDASSLDTEQLVKKSENIIDVNEFWRADSQSSFVFNALLGPALVFEYNDGSIDMLRANDEFFSLLGLDSDHAPFHKLSLIDQICADDRERFISMIEAMSEGGEERAACICWRNGGGEELRRVKVRARMLAESDGRKIIFASLEDITDFC